MRTTTGSERGNLRAGDQSGVSVADVLRKARALIEKPENWLQGEYCDGDKFCLLGAIAKVQELPEYKSEETPAYFAVKAAVRALDPGTVFPHRFNDTHTHAEVLAAFDRAIERATTGTPNHQSDASEQTKGLVP
jgi:hypothetical protein